MTVEMSYVKLFQVLNEEIVCVGKYLLNVEVVICFLQLIVNEMWSDKSTKQHCVQMVTPRWNESKYTCECRRINYKCTFLLQCRNKFMTKKLLH